MLFNANKNQGYVIEAEKDYVKVVSDNGVISNLRFSDIDKKLVVDKRTIGRDSMGNALQVDDVVRVTNKNCNYYGQKGIVKSISKNVLFLWDRSFMTQSYGIFVEN